VSDRDDLERSLSRMVKAAHEEEWNDNRIMLAAAAFMTRVDTLRPTVTPEQVEAAAQAIHAAEAQHDFDIDKAHYDCGNNSRPPLLETWDTAHPEDRDDYRRHAHAALAAFGLSVAEDGE
jgi:hypothetical protein